MIKDAEGTASILIRLIPYAETKEKYSREKIIPKDDCLLSGFIVTKNATLLTQGSLPLKAFQTVEFCGFAPKYE